MSVQQYEQHMRGRWKEMNRSAELVKRREASRKGGEPRKVVVRVPLGTGLGPEEAKAVKAASQALGLPMFVDQERLAREVWYWAGSYAGARRHLFLSTMLPHTSMCGRAWAGDTGIVRNSTRPQCKRCLKIEAEELGEEGFALQGA